MQLSQVRLYLIESIQPQVSNLRLFLFWPGAHFNDIAGNDAKLMQAGIASHLAPDFGLFHGPKPHDFRNPPRHFGALADPVAHGALVAAQGALA